MLLVSVVKNTNAIGAQDLRHLINVSPILTGEGKSDIVIEGNRSRSERSQHDLGVERTKGLPIQGLRNLDVVPPFATGPEYPRPQLRDIRQGGGLLPAGRRSALLRRHNWPTLASQEIVYCSNFVPLR